MHLPLTLMSAFMHHPISSVNEVPHFRGSVSSLSAVNPLKYANLASEDVDNIHHDLGLSRASTDNGNTDAKDNVQKGTTPARLPPTMIQALEETEDEEIEYLGDVKLPWTSTIVQGREKIPSKEEFDYTKEHSSFISAFQNRVTEEGYAFSNQRMAEVMRKMGGFERVLKMMKMFPGLEQPLLLLPWQELGDEYCHLAAQLAKRFPETSAAMKADIKSYLVMNYAETLDEALKEWSSLSYFDQQKEFDFVARPEQLLKLVEPLLRRPKGKSSPSMMLDRILEDLTSRKQLHVMNVLVLLSF